jgi:hypothetical protein
MKAAACRPPEHDGTGMQAVIALLSVDALYVSRLQESSILGE